MSGNPASDRGRGWDLGSGVFHDVPNKIASFFYDNPQNALQYVQKNHPDALAIIEKKGEDYLDNAWDRFVGGFQPAKGTPAYNQGPRQTPNKPNQEQSKPLQEVIKPTPLYAQKHEQPFVQAAPLQAPDQKKQKMNINSNCLAMGKALLYTKSGSGICMSEDVVTKLLITDIRSFLSKYKGGHLIVAKGISDEDTELADKIVNEDIHNESIEKGEIKLIKSIISFRLENNEVFVKVGSTKVTAEQSNKVNASLFPMISKQMPTDAKTILDLTIYGDIEKNPGPVEHHKVKASTMQIVINLKWKNRLKNTNICYEHTNCLLIEYIIKGVTNKQLLKLSGDIEENPGPKYVATKYNVDLDMYNPIDIKHTPAKPSSVGYLVPIYDILLKLGLGDTSTTFTNRPDAWNGGETAHLDYGAITTTQPLLAQEIFFIPQTLPSPVDGVTMVGITVSSLSAVGGLTASDNSRFVNGIWNWETAPNHLSSKDNGGIAIGASFEQESKTKSIQTNSKTGYDGYAPNGMSLDTLQQVMGAQFKYDIKEGARLNITSCIQKIISYTLWSKVEISNNTIMDTYSAANLGQQFTDLKITGFPSYTNAYTPPNAAGPNWPREVNAFNGLCTLAFFDSVRSAQLWPGLNYIIVFPNQPDLYLVAHLLGILPYPWRIPTIAATITSTIANGTPQVTSVLPVNMLYHRIGGIGGGIAVVVGTGPINMNAGPTANGAIVANQILTINVFGAVITTYAMTDYLASWMISANFSSGLAQAAFDLYVNHWPELADQYHIGQMQALASLGVYATKAKCVDPCVSVPSYNVGNSLTDGNFFQMNWANNMHMDHYTAFGAPRLNGYSALITNATSNNAMPDLSILTVPEVGIGALNLLMTGLGTPISGTFSPGLDVIGGLKLGNNNIRSLATVIMRKIACGFDTLNEQFKMNVQDTILPAQNALWSTITNTDDDRLNNVYFGSISQYANIILDQEITWTWSRMTYRYLDYTTIFQPSSQNIGNCFEYPALLDTNIRFFMTPEYAMTPDAIPIASTYVATPSTTSYTDVQPMNSYNTIGLPFKEGSMPMSLYSRAIAELILKTDAQYPADYISTINQIPWLVGNTNFYMYNPVGSVLIQALLRTSCLSPYFRGSALGAPTTVYVRTYWNFTPNLANQRLLITVATAQAKIVSTGNALLTNWDWWPTRSTASILSTSTRPKVLLDSVRGNLLNLGSSTNFSYSKTELLDGVMEQSQKRQKIEENTANLNSASKNESDTSNLLT